MNDPAPPSPRPMDPRRLLRPLRWILLLVVGVLLWRTAERYTLVTLPDGPVPTFALAAGQRVVVEPVRRPDRDLSIGDVIFFAGRDGEVAYGQLVALSGDAIEYDESTRRVRRAGDESWYPIPSRLVDRLPLEPGHALVLAEDALAARECGEIVAIDRIVARLVVPLPF